MNTKNKITKFYLLLILLIITASCSKEPELTANPDGVFPELELSQIDKELTQLYKEYNCRIEYRYVENLLPLDWYNITPVDAKQVVPMATFLKENWVMPLEAASSHEFVVKTFPTQLVFVGSPAFQKDGKTEVLGQAEGGTLLRFTRVNDFDPNNQDWAITQLITAFHEYAHILHQTFRMPDEFRKVTPNNYTKNGWMAVNNTQAVMLGMVSPYGTSSVQEDFAELFSFYIVMPDYLIDDRFVDKNPEDYPWVSEEVVRAVNQGSAILRVKLDILKKFLAEHGFDLETARNNLQEKLTSN